jgi:predicted small secreted protein
VKRVALFASLLLLALLVAACGADTTEGEDTDQNRPEAQTISAGQVITRFQDAPGRPLLKRAAGTDAAWEQLSLGLDVPPALQERYGTFSVYVVEPGNTEAVESLLRDKETQEPLEQGPGGIYWELDELANTYVAYKRFGENAVLVWWNERPRPATDARWRRLDTLMAGLATG